MLSISTRHDKENEKEKPGEDHFKEHLETGSDTLDTAMKLAKLTGKVPKWMETMWDVTKTGTDMVTDKTVHKGTLGLVEKGIHGLTSFGLDHVMPTWMSLGDRYTGKHLEKTADLTTKSLFTLGTTLATGNLNPAEKLSKMMKDGKFNTEGKKLHQTGEWLGKYGYDLKTGNLDGLEKPANTLMNNRYIGKPLRKFRKFTEDGLVPTLLGEQKHKYLPLPKQSPQEKKEEDDMVRRNTLETMKRFKQAENNRWKNGIYDKENMVTHPEPMSDLPGPEKYVSE